MTTTASRTSPSAASCALKFFLSLVISVGLSGLAHAESKSAKRENVRLLTWNILKADNGPLLGAPWEQRKLSFKDIIPEGGYDILCLQEALPEQVSYFAELLPHHQVYGIGRRDGKESGEQCPIFFDKRRFELMKFGTFWLCATPDVPGLAWGETCPRISSWVQLKDKNTGNVFQVYNVHMPLNPYGQPKAARLVAQRVSEVEVPVILAGDFNAPRSWPAMKVFYRQGLTEMGRGRPLTYHMRGVRLRSLDHILASSDWAPSDHGIVRERGGRVYPSDHFGMWADLRPTQHPQTANTTTARSTKMKRTLGKRTISKGVHISTTRTRRSPANNPI